MDGVLAIAVAGLAIALAASLYVIQRRTDDVAALRIEAADRARTQARTEAERIADETDRAVGALEALLPVGVLHLDAGRRIERASDRAHALLGAKPGRLPGRTVMEAFLDPRAEELIDGVPVGGSATGELRVGEGEPRILVVHVHRPHATGVLVILEDATELRRLQQIRSEFIDNLSHELRTPLSTVSLLAETLAREAASATSRRGCGSGSPRSRSRRVTSCRWSASCSTSRGSRAAASSRWRRTSTWAGSRRAPSSGCGCSPSATPSR